jgi:prepilin-type N-terminal cleavage/methylation domain-containing protein
MKIPDRGIQMADNERGFTLIEMLIVLAIFAGLTICIASSVRSGIGTWQKIEMTATAQQEARTALGLLSTDLRQSMSVPGVSFVGTGKSISFCTSRDKSQNPGFPATDVIHVSYGTSPLKSNLRGDTMPNEHDILNRAAVSIISQEPMRQIENQQLTSGPTAFSVEYAYRKPNSSHDDLFWKDLWQDNAKIPKLIRFHLSIQTLKSMDSPIIVQRSVSIPHGIIPVWKEQ